jgi:hypothetical protein
MPKGQSLEATGALKKEFQDRRTFLQAIVQKTKKAAQSAALFVFLVPSIEAGGT